MCYFSIVLVSKTSDLEYIKFTWNKNTASEFEQHWKENKMSKKADFIHMIQVNKDPHYERQRCTPRVFNLPTCWFCCLDPFSGFITGIDCLRGTLKLYVSVNMLQMYMCAPSNIEH